MGRRDDWDVSNRARRARGLWLCRLAGGSDVTHQRPRQYRGVRQNQLIGYGLVVGLNGTGDTLNNAPFTKQSLQAMLERLGVNIRGQQIRTGNVAAVMVTADLPPFATQGTRIDVTASAIGNAKASRAARCLSPRSSAPTATSMPWRKARSALVASRLKARQPRSPVACQPVGRLPNGAIIEREIEFALNTVGQLRLALRNADFTTAKRIAVAINDYIGAPVAEPLDPSTVQLVPDTRRTSSPC